MSSAGRKKDRTRLSTWPLMGFLIGLLLSTPPSASPNDPEPGYILILAIAAGIVLAIFSFVAALALNGYLGEAKSSIPGNNQPIRVALFLVSCAASFGLKVSGNYSLVSVLLGIVAVSIIAKKGRDATN